MAEDDIATQPQYYVTAPKVTEWRVNRGPRNVRIIRADYGFGFTLRHFIVYPPESYQVLAGDRLLGLRLSEGRGDESLDTIFVKSVRPGSPAAYAGLSTGDRILGVNGEPTVHRPYSYVIQLIQNSKEHISLLVVSKEEDIIQMYFSEAAHNPETNNRPGRLRSPEMHRPNPKHPALNVPRRSLDAMPQHHTVAIQQHASLQHPSRPPLSSGQALDYDRPHLNTSAALERPLLCPSPALERPILVTSPAIERPTLISSPALDRPSASIDYDHRFDAVSHRLLDPLTTPGSRLSLDGGSPSRDSRESSVNSVHSSDDSVIISRIIKSCEQKKEFLRRPVVWSQPNQPPSLGSRDRSQYWGQPPVWPSAIPASAVPPAKPPSPVPFICGGPVSNPPVTMRQQPVRFVSERARQFETGQCQADKIMLYKSELARLGQTNSGSNVAVRRREYESRSNEWRNQRESRSLDSTASNSSLSGSQISSRGATSTPVQYISGNRTIPVGGLRPHCEPPPSTSTSNHEEDLRPRSNSLGTVKEDANEKRRNKAVRQDSYLAAVKKFVDKSSDSTESTSGSTPHSSPGLDSVVRRSKPPSIDSQDDDRSTRRESYLRATSDRHMETDEDPEPAYRSISHHLPACDKQCLIEGSLHCKVTLVEGKKSHDRSWKNVYGVLKGSTLYLFRDKKDSLSETPVDYERIDMEGVSVSVAEDYSKRRHVLKLSSTCSSEILLQADSQSDMNRWLHALHHDNNNTQSIGSVASTSGTSKASSSSSLSNKLGFRNRSPTGSSPTSKNRKPSQTDGSQPGCSGVGGVNAGASSSGSVNVGASTSGATPAVVVAPPPKEKEKVKKENWSKRLAGGLMFNKKSPSPTIHYPEGATIGVPIQLCPESTNLEGIPLLVEMCINLVEERGLDAIGIYRVPGNTAAVTSLTEAVNRGLDDSVLEQDPRYSDVNVISSLLKSFFRRLPDCLLTSELYPQFIEADKIQDPKTRVAVLRRLVHELPPQNFNTLRYLLFHLKNVMDNCEVNKMEPRNLAIVFGPTLIKAGDNNMMTLVNDMSHQCRIVETLLLYVDWVYSDGDLEELELREDTYSSELAESELNNQSLLLDNIHKVEGLKESPTRDMSAKDIVSSIISAANRKMQKAKRGKSIVSITEENLPTPTDNSIETSKHNNTSNTKSEKGDPPGACRAVDRSAGAATQAPVQTRNTSAMTLVASHVRQSVLFSGSVASKILSSNDSQQDKSNEERNAGNDSKDNSSEQSNTELDSNKNAVKENKDLNEMSKSVEGGTIRSYTGLHQVTQERVRRFEMETKAMLHREPRKRDELNTSLSAIGQSITSSKEAVDKIGKRLKTCKQLQAVANSGNSSIRKGSLDSLKDNSWSDWNNSTTSVSTDECGDLVVSLTSTFDAKMKDLSVMKESKVETSSLSSDKELSDKEKPVSNDEDFRDPSLHKTSPSITLTKSSDAKIKGGDDKDKESEVLSDKENCNTKLRRSESLNKRGEEKKESCKLRRTESLNKRESKSNSDNKLKRSDSLTKNEKTESNLNKRRQLEAGKMYKMKRKTGGNNERSIKRRHTVGGTKDFDKVTWLDNRQAEENEKSRRTSSPDLSRHVLMEVRPWSLVEPTHVISRPLESHM